MACPAESGRTRWFRGRAMIPPPANHRPAPHARGCQAGPSRLGGRLPRSVLSLKNPCPSSSMIRITSRSATLSTTPTRVASAWRTTLVSASCSTRYSVVSISGDRRSSCKPMCRSNGMPERSLQLSSRFRIAVSMPRSSKAVGRISHARRLRSRPNSAVSSFNASSRSCTSRLSIVAPPSPSRPSCSSVKDWPSVSCSSRAIRRRSASWSRHGPPQHLGQFGLQNRPPLGFQLQGFRRRLPLFHPKIQFTGQLLLPLPRRLALACGLIECAAARLPATTAATVRRNRSRPAATGGRAAASTAARAQ